MHAEVAAILLGSIAAGLASAVTGLLPIELYVLSIASAQPTQLAVPAAVCAAVGQALGKTVGPPIPPGLGDGRPEPRQPRRCGASVEPRLALESSAPAHGRR